MKHRDKRKLRRWDVTTSAINEATGRSPRSIRADINAGVLDPWDMWSLAQYVFLHRAKAQVRTGLEKDVDIPEPKVQANVSSGAACGSLSSPTASPRVAPPSPPPAHTERRKGVFM